MRINIWHNKDEETVDYYNPRTGKATELKSAHELIQFLIEKSGGKMKIDIKIEQN